VADNARPAAADIIQAATATNRFRACEVFANVAYDNSAKWAEALAKQLGGIARDEQAALGEDRLPAGEAASLAAWVVPLLWADELAPDRYRDPRRPPVGDEPKPRLWDPPSP
jgi:hypothetical protein